MNCEECGAELPQNAKFCSKCGSVQPKDPAVPYAERPTGLKAPPRVLLVVGTAAAGIAGLAVLILVLANPFSRGGAEIGTTPEPVATSDDVARPQPGQTADTGDVVSPTPTPLPVVAASADDDPFMGPPDAPVTIIEFGDYQ
jgi:protein-disulfide isomerase